MNALATLVIESRECILIRRSLLINNSLFLLRNLQDSKGLNFLLYCQFNSLDLNTRDGTIITRYLVHMSRDVAVKDLYPHVEAEIEFRRNFKFRF